MPSKTETRELQKQILRSKLRRAAAMSEGERLIEGIRLFDRVCERMRDGIRHEMPARLGVRHPMDLRTWNGRLAERDSRLDRLTSGQERLRRLRLRKTDPSARTAAFQAAIENDVGRFVKAHAGPGTIFESGWTRQYDHLPMLRKEFDQAAETETGLKWIGRISWLLSLFILPEPENLGFVISVTAGSILAIATATWMARDAAKKAATLSKWITDSEGKAAGE